MDIDGERSRIAGLDMVKGMACIGVIAVHSVPRALLLSTGLIFVVQPVAAFCLLLGVNLVLHARRRALSSPFGLFSVSYLLDRLDRLFLPILWVLAVTLVIELPAGTDVVSRYLIPRYAAGVLPGVSGYGDYFIALLWQFCWLSPLLWLLYRKVPPATFWIACALIEVAFHLAMSRTPWGLANYWLYRASILRYLSIVAAGVLLADFIASAERAHRMSPAVRTLLGVYGGIGVAMTFVQRYLGFVPFLDRWNGSNLMTFGLPVLLVSLAILARARFDRTWARRLSHPIEAVGRASLHVFLVQMLYFSYVEPLLGSAQPHMAAFRFPIALAVALPLGVAFWLGESRVRSAISGRLLGSLRGP
ncbi:hypothetical protein KJ567_01095 [Candidatus Bipolaricaulota bacterium]|nr:hypothetical protein [Candidatus Bipolaricaulota bacterium]